MNKLDYPMGSVWTTNIKRRRELRKDDYLLELLVFKKNDVSIYIVNIVYHCNCYFCEEKNWEDSLNFYNQLFKKLIEVKLGDFIQFDQESYKKFTSQVFDLKNKPWFLKE